MKKLIYTLGIIAAAAFTFSSCQKEQSIDQPSSELVTVTFTAEKAGLDTKTAAVESDTEVSFIWTEEDLANIKLFTVGEDADGKEELTVVANPTITKVSDTKLTIAGKVAPNATYTFRAVLSGKWTNKNHPRLSETQSPSTSNFDPTADILISDDMEVTVGAAEEGGATVTTSALEMVFRRPVVVNKMTLKNLMKGEAIDKVVITSGKDLAGYVNSDSKTAVGDKKTITLNYNKAVTVPEGGQFPVYFTTIPGTDHSLTVEVTTDQFVYTKSFAEGKSVDFNLGEFTKFNLVLPEGVANSALTLPFTDDFSWQTKTAENGLSSVGEGYSDFKNVYEGKASGVIRLGKSAEVGYITTKDIDLSKAFYVVVSARAYNAGDNSKIKVIIDGETSQTASTAMTSTETFTDYIFNFSAATNKSKVTITTDTKRAVLTDLQIISGTYVFPPVINVTTDNPMAVENTASSQTIEYTIDNPTTASLTASTTASWISNIDYATSGQVTFDVAAQETGAAARSGVITLSYTGAPDVEVTVNQAAGSGGTTTKTFTIASADVVSGSGYSTYSATVDGRDWIITFGGNNKSVGTNSGNRTKCTLSENSKYAVSPVTTSSIASAFASTTSIADVKKISYTFSGGSNQTSTNVYLLYSADGTDFSQIALTSGTQGAAISSGAEFEFAKCSGYFAVLFVATNSSGAWRIDDVNLTFTYEE